MDLIGIILRVMSICMTLSQSIQTLSPLNPSKECLSRFRDQLTRLVTSVAALRKLLVEQMHWRQNYLDAEQFDDTLDGITVRIEHTLGVLAPFLGGQTKRFLRWPVAARSFKSAVETINRDLMVLTKVLSLQISLDVGSRLQGIAVELADIKSDAKDLTLMVNRRFNQDESRLEDITNILYRTRNEPARRESVPDAQPVDHDLAGVTAIDSSVAQDSFIDTEETMESSRSKTDAGLSVGDLDEPVESSAEKMGLCLDTIISIQNDLTYISGGAADE